MAAGNSYFGQLTASWGSHQIFFVRHQTAKMVLSAPGSPFTAHPQLKPFVSPSLNPDNKSHHPQVKSVVLVSLEARSHFILGQLKTQHLHPSTSHMVQNLDVKDVKRCQRCRSLFTLAWGKKSEFL